MKITMLMQPTTLAKLPGNVVTQVLDLHLEKCTVNLFMWMRNKGVDRNLSEQVISYLRAQMDEEFRVIRNNIGSDTVMDKISVNMSLGLEFNTSIKETVDYFQTLSEKLAVKFPIIDLLFRLNGSDKDMPSGSEIYLGRPYSIRTLTKTCNKH